MGLDYPFDIPGDTGKVFAHQLLKWNRETNSRQMPWKNEKDPYRIWLSEIILQQTRVEQGLKYYENFTRRFPDVHSLANATDDEVFKCWEGLGYYSRCRNLIASARFISRELNGIFPGDYDSILSLKGVGPYTAAAISSFAYDQPYAVVDGNVYRVLSRIFLIELPVDSTEGKKLFSHLAQEILPKKNPGEYNQAIMDFGAVICKPYPECAICFFSAHCKAFLAGRQDVLPFKEKKVRIRERWLNYLVLVSKDKVLIHQRSAKDIWQNLFEFLLLETGHDTSDPLLLLENQYGIRVDQVLETVSFDQKLTHQLLHFTINLVSVHGEKQVPGHNWVKKAELGKYAFPKSLQQFASLLQK